MPAFDVSCIGFCVLDILGRPVRRIPEGGRADFIEEIRMTVAGTAGATAVASAILGLKVRIVTAVGEDEMGDFLVAKMEKFGVDCGLVARDGTVQTSATILPVRPNGERPALHVPGTAATFTFPEERLEDALNAPIVHVGGTGLLKSFDGAPTVRVLKAAKERGRVTTFDLIQANPETFALVEPCLPHIDYFVPSIEEAAEMAGVQEPREVARFYKARGVRNVLLTMGGDGVHVSPEEGGDFALPAFDVPVSDTTGCGDAFTAGIIVGLHRGWELRRSAAFASAVAARVATGLGSDGRLVSFDDAVGAMKALPTRPVP
ncbi:MAG: sugar kinase [Geminicoccaceae bacterium]|nr:sugar kinase [Geminicoccaceae bacterium]